MRDKEEKTDTRMEMKGDKGKRKLTMDKQYGLNKRGKRKKGG